jgi:hypothetical protein
MQVVLLVGAVVSVTWGVLAFGSVYPWAYTPLAIACALTGIGGLLAGRLGRPPLGRLTIGLSAIAITVSLQLVPLSREMVDRINPGTGAILSQYDFSYLYPGGLDNPGATGKSLPRQPVSIQPSKTALGLGLFAAFALFLLGLTRLLSTVGTRPVAMSLLGLGILLTVLAAIQLWLNPDPMQLTLIYGFWKPKGVSQPFGPFVNPNHYAGWMLMAMPVVLGLGYGTFERARLGAPRGGTAAAANETGMLVLSAFACLVMGVSLVMTRSRSGLVGLAVAILAVSVMVIVRQRTGRARAVVAGVFALLFVAIVELAGVDAMEKFRTPPDSPASMRSRIGAWKDTLRIIRDNPLTGTGLDTYGTAMMVYQTANRSRHFREAHNDYLQIAAEGGLLVGLPVLATLWVFAADIRRRFREAPREGQTYWIRVGAVVGMIAIAVQSLVEFSLQMPGNAALFVLLAAIALHQSPRLASASNSRPSS